MKWYIFVATNLLGTKLSPMKQLLTICILLALTTSCNNKKVKNIEDFSVKAELIETGDFVTCDCNKVDKDEYFYNRVVRISVKNNAEIPKSFWIMTCSWQESFRCDNEEIFFVQRECNGNFPIEIKLPPYQTITFTTILRQKLYAVSQSCRIGLIMLNENDYYSRDKKFNSEYKASRKTYWSNSLTFDSKSFGYTWKE